MPAKQLHRFHRLPLQVNISAISSCSYDNRIADATTGARPRAPFACSTFKVQRSRLPTLNLEPGTLNRAAGAVASPHQA
jgi:hypothetical protein